MSHAKGHELVAIKTSSVLKLAFVRHQLPTAKRKGTELITSDFRQLIIICSQILKAPDSLADYRAWKKLHSSILTGVPKLGACGFAEPQYFFCWN